MSSPKEAALLSGSPVRYEQMFYKNEEGRTAELNGKTFPQSPLVWRGSHGRLRIRALAEKKRPHAKTKMASATFWNVSNNGEVCLESMRCPDSAVASAMPARSSVNLPRAVHLIFMPETLAQLVCSRHNCNLSYVWKPAIIAMLASLKAGVQ